MKLERNEANRPGAFTRRDADVINPTGWYHKKDRQTGESTPVEPQFNFVQGGKMYQFPCSIAVKDATERTNGPKGTLVYHRFDRKFFIRLRRTPQGEGVDDRIEVVGFDEIPTYISQPGLFNARRTEQMALNENNEMAPRTTIEFRIFPKTGEVSLLGWPPTLDSGSVLTFLNAVDKVDEFKLEDEVVTLGGKVYLVSDLRGTTVTLTPR